ncbi:MAG: ABC transporter permease [Oscillospiraceae bacterium]|nr:ABC transporter permease [Oscillospiraceae bacterium]
MKKLKSIKNNWQSLSLVAGTALLWQLISLAGLADPFILPPPSAVISAFCKDFQLIASHSLTTLVQAFIGLGISIILGYAAAIGMDRFSWLQKALYPLLVLSQTVPYIAIAPLLVLWLGFGMTPKIVLVCLICFFPIAVNVYDGIRGIRKEYIDEFNVLGGNWLESLIFVKLPLSLPGFFSAIKIAGAYSIVGAVISEWIGGTKGIGVYMTRVRKSYEFDKMFAVILLISLLSLGLLSIIKIIERRAIKYVEEK